VADSHSATSSVPGSAPESGGTVAAGKPAPIEVGIMLFPDLNQFAAKFGGTADTGNQSLQVDTVVNWINKHGGAAGHPIVAVKHNISMSSSESYDQLAQEACEDFTVDHHAVAAITPGAVVSNNFAACLQRRGALYISSGLWVHDATDFKHYSNMFGPGETDARGVGQAMVEAVLHRPLAKRGETVGLMVEEEPGGLRTADGIVKPQLKAAGVNVVEYTVPAPASTADVSNSVAAIQSAELRMASQGVQTVLFLCQGCVPFFAQYADSQHYYPRYVGSSYDNPTSLAGTNNDRTMKSAIMVGFEPDRDVGLYTHPKELTDNPTRKLCHSIMKPSGQVTGDLSEFSTQIICDGFLQVMYAAQLNPTNPITGPAVQVGMGRFGTRHPSALNFATLLSPGHHGGDTSYRWMHWDRSTHQFTYDSPTRYAFRLPS
jgi:hypothetical protein